MLFVISCINLNDPRHQAEYIQCYNSFQKEMVEHIPNKLPNNQISHGWAPPKHIDVIGNYAGIHLVTKIASKSDYLNHKAKLSSNIKFKGLSTDTCFIIVKTYGELLNSDFDKNNCENLYPIPQYAIYKYDNFDLKWSRQENSDVIISDCKSGDYLNRDVLKPKEGMTPEWEKGYSKGFTFNDKEQTINYWIIIW